MYADDSTMFSVAHTLTELQEHLSDELLTITKWVRINKLILNWEKLNILFLVTEIVWLKLLIWIYLLTGCQWNK